jgi:hypothetical protein
MKAKISIFIIALFALAFLEPLLTAQPAGNRVELSAYIDVSSDGNATVKIAIQYKGRATFFMTLPKFQPVYLCNETGIGKLNIQNETSSAYFYYNSTITINDDNPGRLVLCYSFPSAVLMAGTRGWFMSPLLWTNFDKVSVYVSLPMAKKITYESPVSTSISGNYRVYTLSAGIPQDIGNRVTIEFDLKENVKENILQEKTPQTIITVKYPVFYRNIAENTLKTAIKSIQYLNNLTGVTPRNVTLVFYLPEKKMGGIYALGFVLGEDVNAGGKGPIYLNLALTRYAPGYMETTIIHELVHVYLGMVGVEANDATRWFHEGMAQYLSIKIAEAIGINVSEYKNDMYNSSKALYYYTGGKFGFIQKWPSDDVSEQEAYLASFYIIANISDSYGGLSYAQRVFSELRKHPVSTSSDIVIVLSQAAGRNLAPFFRSLGFSNIQDWSPTPSAGNTVTTRDTPFVSGYMSLIVALGLSLLIFLVVYYGNFEINQKLKMGNFETL